MAERLAVLLPLLLLSAAITYASFSSPLDVGTGSDPNVVETTYLEWNVYQMSELGWPWHHIPDVGDARLDDPTWVGCMVSCMGTTDPACYCENPDVGNAAAYKLNSKTVHFEISNAYPGYAAVTHFVFMNEGGMPSKLRNVELELNDPDNLEDDLRTALLLVWDTDPDDGIITGVRIVGYRLSDLPDIVESLLADEVFLPGGWVGFCRPENASVQIIDEIIGSDSGLSEEQINDMLSVDSFWIYVPPTFGPPQGATMDFNLTFVFGQFNE